MRLNKSYIAIRDKWWGLPLVLPSLFLPLVSHTNTYAHVATGDVILFYLPLSLMMSLMIFFGWAALPGIVLAVFIRKYPQVGLVETLPIVAHFLIAIVLSWGGIVSLHPGVTTSRMGTRSWSSLAFLAGFLSCDAISGAFPVCSLCGDV